MRPIDADAVLKKVLSIPPYCGHCDGYGFVQLDMVEDAIKDAPTIEAASVKHGRWERYKDDKFMGYNAAGKLKYRKVYTYECDNCRNSTAVKSKYCPNCGAKMDLEGEG